jgi:hypothetical protein
MIIIIIFSPKRDKHEFRLAINVACHEPRAYAKANQLPPRRRNEWNNAMLLLLSLVLATIVPLSNPLDSDTGCKRPCE